MSTQIVYLHPTATLNISDSLTRLNQTSDGDTQIGLLLGKLSQTTTSVLNAIEIPPSEYTNESALHSHIDLLSEVYGSGYLEVVGLYSIGTVGQNLISRISSNLSPTNQDTKTLIRNPINKLILLQSEKNVPEDMSLGEMFKFTNIVDYTELDFVIKDTLAEHISMSMYKDSPQSFNDMSNTIQSDIDESLADLSTKLQKPLKFLELVKQGQIDINNNLEAKAALESLSLLAHRYLVLKQLIQNESSTMQDNISNDISQLIAITSSYSSLIRGNL